MCSTIEDLAIELWLEIFNYLKLVHQFNAFFNLNKRLNQILFSYRSHIISKNNDEDSQYLFTHILPFLTHREGVTKLKFENTNKVNQIIDTIIEKINIFRLNLSIKKIYCTFLV